MWPPASPRRAPTAPPDGPPGALAPQPALTVVGTAPRSWPLQVPARQRFGHRAGPELLVGAPLEDPLCRRPGDRAHEHRPRPGGRLKSRRHRHHLAYCPVVGGAVVGGAAPGQRAHHGPPGLGYRRGPKAAPLGVRGRPRRGPTAPENPPSPPARGRPRAPRERRKAPPGRPRTLPSPSRLGLRPRRSPPPELRRPPGAGLPGPVCGRLPAAGRARRKGP